MSLHPIAATSSVMDDQSGGGRTFSVIRLTDTLTLNPDGLIALP